MKVVVTGATGHLGTFVTEALSSSGHDVVAVSRSGAIPKPPFGAPPRARSVRALALDVAQSAVTEPLAKELEGGAALVHLAAWHPPSTANTTPADRRKLIDVNVYGTMRVLEAARAARVSTVVYASSFEVYGEVEGVVTEDSRVTPITDYGATKLSGEDHLIAFAAEENARVVALRMPAIYGPGELTSRALPNFLRAAALGKTPVISGDGADLRDQLHARDAARAIELALEPTANGIFNVADGEPHSIAELATVAMQVAGLPGGPQHSERTKPRRDYHMNIARARAELGFAPRVALRDGAAEELAWLRAGN